MRRVSLVLALALGVEVIRAAGGEPIGPYLIRLAPQTSHGDQTSHTPATQSDRRYRLTHYLPIRSPSLSPGTAEAHPRPTRLLQPIFLVGTDPQSLAWLDANREISPVWGLCSTYTSRPSVAIRSLIQRGMSLDAGA